MLWQTARVRKVPRHDLVGKAILQTNDGGKINDIVQKIIKLGREHHR